LQRESRKGRGLVVAGVVGLLTILVLELALSIRQESITWDEDDHLYSGYMSWKTGDFGLNPEHPPMVKMLAALPILGMELKVPALQRRNFKHEAFLGGKDFLFKNDANTMLFRARMAASMLTVLLAILVFLAAQEMFSTGAAFLALTLLVFDPNLLAHGALVTTDAGLSCFLFASVYAFYRYVKAPSAWRLVVVGLATGLAFAAKHTGVLAAPILIVLALCELWRNQDTPKNENRAASSTGSQFLRMLGALVVVAAISLTVLWGFYGFRYAARPVGLDLNPTSAEYLQQLSRPNEAKLLTSIAKYHLLPESYLYGLADVRMIADFYSSYALGTTYPHGVWFYFPLAIAIKSTLAFLIFLAITVWAIATRRLTKWREILFLTVPPVLYLIVAMSSRMNIGMRHILPMYPFLTVLVAGAAWTLIQRNRKWVYAVGVLVVFQIVTSLHAFPMYIPYANELWGGSSQTYRLLSDSNADWGEQLKATKKYLDQRGIKDCWFVYFAEGVVDYTYYGIPCKALPTSDAMWVNEKFNPPAEIDGPVLISAANLSGFEYGPGELNPYEQFKSLTPTAVIAHEVFVYDGHFAIPLAAAIGHAQKATDLLAAKQLPEALSEAQQAVALAPNTVNPNVVLGDVLAALGQSDEAKKSYEKALLLAQTVHPEFQVGWVGTIQQKLASK
jgi:tetratricopeptide (TPR) repeat protein